MSRLPVTSTSEPIHSLTTSISKFATRTTLLAGLAVAVVGCASTVVNSQGNGTDASVEVVMPSDSPAPSDVPVQRDSGLRPDSTPSRDVVSADSIADVPTDTTPAFPTIPCGQALIGKLNTPAGGSGLDRLSFAGRSVTVASIGTTFNVEEIPGATVDNATLTVYHGSEVYLTGYAFNSEFPNSPSEGLAIDGFSYNVLKVDRTDSVHPLVTVEVQPDCISSCPFPDAPSPAVLNVGDSHYVGPSDGMGALVRFEGVNGSPFLLPGYTPLFGINYEIQTATSVGGSVTATSDPLYEFQTQGSSLGYRLGVPITPMVNPYLVQFGLELYILTGASSTPTYNPAIDGVHIAVQVNQDCRYTPTPHPTSTDAGTD